MERTHDRTHLRRRVLADDLELDPPPRPSGSSTAVREPGLQPLRRKGAVLGLSGGIDSSVAAALCVRALGPERVFGLFMPERDSSRRQPRAGATAGRAPGHRDRARRHRRRRSRRPAATAAATRRSAACFPSTGRATSRRSCCPSLFERQRLPRLLRGRSSRPTARCTASACRWTPIRQVVAATNFKQRVRKMMEYYHADRLRYAVAGTPNRLEYDQGFFVKNGDGAADLKPIAHLYKTQVYQLAEYLGVPEEIRRRPPTTDTYSLEQSQEEFFFSLPYDQMDLCLYGKNHADPGGRSRRGRSGSPPSRSSGSTATSTPSGGRPATCTSRRCWRRRLLRTILLRLGLERCCAKQYTMGKIFGRVAPSGFRLAICGRLNSAVALAQLWEFPRCGRAAAYFWFTADAVLLLRGVA